MTPPPVLSVSQVEKFDPEQTGGCQRRWWFEDVRKLRAESTAAHEDGHRGHALLAHYLATGERPGRVRLGKAINAVIDAGRLPRPGPHLQVEARFSGQLHRDTSGAWVPLNTSQTLWHAGHPWDGFIDLRFRHRDRAVTVWDHKFSSDIHARALPAERLIRTVQMPIYALDALRQWPDATAVNLVHLYVSRRGVESFVRHQRVGVEQVHQRAREIAGLVHQMDAVRTATAQDDVPFNRAACHARMGCPHQFRCNAFKRRGTMMDLSDEEKAMFGMLSEERPRYDRREDVDDAGPPSPARATGPLPDAPAGRVTVPADLNLDDIFEDMPAPAASTPKPQPAPTCEACGEVLTPENSSRLKTGDVKHIGCAKGGLNLAGGGAIVIDALPTASAPRCADCPHPAHAGKPCEGKRGRGACRCGAAVEQPQRPPVPPAPKHVEQEPARMTEAAMEREAVDDNHPFNAVDPALDEAEQLSEEETRAARELAQAEGRMPPQARRGPAPAGSWSGTLAVNVTVELGPSTLAFLAGLVKR